MKDYTTDKRGDIGSISREASMLTMSNILKLVASFNKTNQETKKQINLGSKILQNVVSSLLQQLLEKIDRIRLIAGSILQGLFDGYMNYLPDFPHKKQISKIFSKSNIKVLFFIN